MIDMIEWIYIIFIGFFLVLLAGFIGWILNPFNKARLLRSATGKNIGVIVLRGTGGQLVFKTHNFNLLTFNYGPKDQQKTYLVKPGNQVDRKGAVPIMYFQMDNAVPITFNEILPKTAPENLNSIFMLLKAWIESGAALAQNKLFLLACATLILVVIGLALTYNTGSSCGSIGDKVNLLIAQQNIAIPSPTPFSLR